MEIINDEYKDTKYYISYDDLEQNAWGVMRKGDI
jgi:hypothetical protein